MQVYRFPDADFDARLTLIDSAQAFNWRETSDGIFSAVSGGVPMRVTQMEHGIKVEAPEGASEALVRRYFDLDRDYRAIVREYCDCPPAVEAFSKLPGLRVLRQPAWEALVTFLLSQNNNTARIGKLVRTVCETFGGRVEAFGCVLHAFPTPEALYEAGTEALRGLGCGYRAEYLAGTAQRMLEGFPLEELQAMPYEEARGKLMELPGVGPKVADCVLLFGCGHLSAYPVDVWVARLSRAWLGLEGETAKAISESARARLGPHAGILQQYLFHCARCGIIET